MNKHGTVFLTCGFFVFTNIGTLYVKKERLRTQLKLVSAETIVNTQQQLTRLINIACYHQQSKTVQNTKKHTLSINTGWLISQDHAKNVVLECFLKHICL